MPRRAKKPTPADFTDGLYIVTPPPWGVTNKWVGRFEDGAEPREVRLSGDQARELAGPDHPFTVEPAPEAPPAKE